MVSVFKFQQTCCGEEILGHLIIPTKKNPENLFECYLHHDNCFKNTEGLVWQFKKGTPDVDVSALIKLYKDLGISSLFIIAIKDPCTLPKTDDAFLRFLHAQLKMVATVERTSWEMPGDESPRDENDNNNSDDEGSEICDSLRNSTGGGYCPGDDGGDIDSDEEQMPPVKKKART